MLVLISGQLISALQTDLFHITAASYLVVLWIMLFVGSGRRALKA